jgi:hypothetical protein
LYDRYGNNKNKLRGDIVKICIVRQYDKRLMPVKEASVEASKSIQMSLSDRDRDEIVAMRDFEAKWKAQD